MGPEHRWLQARIRRICEKIGHEAVIEHVPTNSDVFVPQAGLSIEVQRWATDFEVRTRARHRDGATRVLWLVTQDTSPPSVGAALRRLPAARILVHKQGELRNVVTPWEHPEQSFDARLSVFATVAHLRDGKLVTGHLSFFTFLTQVLRGERAWSPPGTPGLPWPTWGAWVRHQDLLGVQTSLRQARSQARARPKTITHPVPRVETNGVDLEMPAPQPTAAKDPTAQPEAPEPPVLARLGNDATPVPGAEADQAPGSTVPENVAPTPAATSETPLPDVPPEDGAPPERSLWARFKRWLFV
ncbi:MAG: hypothetical protein WBG57_05910 [Ornithinimicrobium sp.]